MKLFVWWIPNPLNTMFKIEVPSPEIGATVLNALAEYDLFLGERIFGTRCGGLMHEDGTKWEDEHGGDVFSFFEKM